jgi:L-lactate dehydrogenase complex protein LldE
MPVALFIPCYIEHLRPGVGVACARVFDRLGLDWRYPRKQSCCGQPAFNVGQHAATVPAARQFLKMFGGGRYRDIVAPSGSCVGMLRRFHQLPGLAEPERDALRELGERCRELSDFLVNGIGRVELGATWPGRVCWQDSCHTLRELGIAEAPRRLLRAVAGLEVVDQHAVECCGFGGLYSVKLPELSCAQADERLSAYARTDSDALVSTDVSCLLHIEARARHRGIPCRGLHLAEIIAGAGRPARGATLEVME